MDTVVIKNVDALELVTSLKINMPFDIGAFGASVQYDCILNESIFISLNEV